MDDKLIVARFTEVMLDDGPDSYWDARYGRIYGVLARWLHRFDMTKCELINTGRFSGEMEQQWCAIRVEVLANNGFV
jgi:hypothetical protein